MAVNVKNVVKPEINMIGGHWRDAGMKNALFVKKYNSVVSGSLMAENYSMLAVCMKQTSK